MSDPAQLAAGGLIGFCLGGIAVLIGFSPDAVVYDRHENQYYVYETPDTELFMNTESRVLITDKKGNQLGIVDVNSGTEKAANK